MVEVSHINIAAALSGYVVPPLLPVNLLRVVPLVSSTMSLQWAVDEYQFLSSWMEPSYRSQADALLPAWFKTWAAQSSTVLFTTFPWSAGAGITNLWLLRNSSFSLGFPFGSGSSSSAAAISGDGIAKTWYAAGVFFAFAHMFFGPKALGLLKKIREGEPAGRPTTSLATWLKMHTIRAFVADLPAVICFAIAASS
ncbi:hypothetical protein I316_04612 [Kwoniella heveanensis BCC8398]|uniref:Uncharacterized protein n=1 Tax=Kwoniella heveanensis BCC8398 TaxID=1296120 RepID=A0A1B9GR40_9TREE|nr:hypothetical protein I316_04612 [Kwoniella heveanensis BCC8398]